VLPAGRYLPLAEEVVELGHFLDERFVIDYVPLSLVDSLLVLVVELLIRGRRSGLVLRVQNRALFSLQMS